MPNENDWYSDALDYLLGVPRPGATRPSRSDWLSQLAALQQAERDRQRRQAEASTDSTTPVVKLPPLSASWVAADSPVVPPRRATDDESFLRELGITT